MSGLCGWFSREPGALPIGQMAAPLSRFDGAPLRTAAHGMGAVALSGGLDCAGLYHEDGLLIAHWGEKVDALARLWRTHGAKACAALSGHFAFALLDEQRGEALLAADRAATRPLFYQLVGRTLVFATSTDALVQHPGAGHEIDPQSLFSYLYFGAVPGPGAAYKGHRRLAPGEFVHLHGGRLERGRYWRMRFSEHQPGPYRELKSELLDTVKAAVDGSLGQQRVGVMLSGGTGSGALAALLQRAGGQRVPTYAVGIASTGRGTLGAARQMARRLRTDHRERLLEASDLADAIPKLAAVFDQPCGDPAAVAAFYCALMAREDGTLRVLGGQGGAVLFGRHARYARQLRMARYEQIPSALRQLLIEPLLFRVARRVTGGPLASLRDHILQAMQPLPARLQHANLMHGHGVENVIEPEFLGRIDPSAPHAALEQAWWLAQCRSQVNRMIALDLQYDLADAELPALSKACELAGVEVAFPYLSDALVAFAARLEPRLKLGIPGQTLFVDALSGIVPARRRAPEPGFTLPIGQWLQADARLRGLAFDSLADLRRRHIVRADFLDTLLSRHLAEQPARHGAMVWRLMMLEQWFAQRRGTPCTQQADTRAALEPAPGRP